MDQSVIRLRVGQDGHGWVVRAADIRAVTLQKDSQQVKLELPARNSTAPPGSEVAHGAAERRSVGLADSVSPGPGPAQHDER